MNVQGSQLSEEASSDGQQQGRVGGARRKRKNTERGGVGGPRSQEQTEP